MFLQAETHLVFPQSASVDQLRLIREKIAAELNLRMRGDPAVPPAAPPAAPHNSAPAINRPAAPPAQQPSSPVELDSYLLLIKIKQYYFCLCLSELSIWILKFRINEHL